MACLGTQSTRPATRQRLLRLPRSALARSLAVTSLPASFFAIHGVHFTIGIYVYLWYIYIYIYHICISYRYKWFCWSPLGSLLCRRNCGRQRSNASVGWLQQKRGLTLIAPSLSRKSGKTKTKTQWPRFWWMQTGTRQVWSHVLEVGVGIKPIYLTWSTYMSLRASSCIDFTLGCFHQPTRDLSEIEKDLEHSRGRAVDHREGNAHRVALDTDPRLSILGTTYIYI